MAAYQNFAAGADLLVHDAEYTAADYIRTRTWGHSTYQDALNLALQAGVRRFGLFHHNQDRTDTDLDQIVADCRRRIREQGSTVECFALAQGMDLHL